MQLFGSIDLIIICRHRTYYGANKYENDPKEHHLISVRFRITFNEV